MATLETPRPLSGQRTHEQRMRLGLDNARWYAELALRNGATHEQVKHTAELAIEHVGLDRIRPTGGATTA